MINGSNKNNEKVKEKTNRKSVGKQWIWIKEK